MSIMRFAIVGGADPARNDPQCGDRYDPKVDVDEARGMAAALGTALAKGGHGLIVYDARSGFIESEVVSAYVAASPRADRSITVRQPQAGTPNVFAEEKEHSGVFQRQVDPSELWEVSFYRSLASSDGVILLGGGRSTLNAGQIAIGARIPVLALEKSGGAAATVWKTIAPGVDLPTSDEHAHMAQRSAEEAAAGWVQDLLSQRRRRYAVESGPIRGHAVVAAALFVLSLVFALGSHLVPWIAPVATSVLLASTLFGGGSGAAIRMVFERRYGSGPLVPPSIAVTLALGVMAGALAGLLYLVAQPAAVVLQGADGMRLVSIMAIVSVIGGLTAETVFRKLLGVDVANTSPLSSSPGAPPGRSP
jgi:hypothetical protein